MLAFLFHSNMLKIVLFSPFLSLWVHFCFLCLVSHVLCDGSTKMFILNFLSVNYCIGRTVFVAGGYDWDQTEGESLPARQHSSAVQDRGLALRALMVGEACAPGARSAGSFPSGRWGFLPLLAVLNYLVFYHMPLSQRTSQGVSCVRILTSENYTCGLISNHIKISGATLTPYLPHS